MKKDLVARVGVITIIIGLLLVTLEVNGQRRRSRQRSSINIPSINTSNTTLRNTLCTSPFSKQRVVGQCKPLVSFQLNILEVHKIIIKGKNLKMSQEVQPLYTNKNEKLQFN